MALVLTSDYEIKQTDGRYQSAQPGDFIIEMTHHPGLSYYRRYVVKEDDVVDLILTGQTLEQICLNTDYIPDAAKQYLLTGDLSWLNIRQKN
jgi:hypothetical protein